MKHNTSQWSTALVLSRDLFLATRFTLQGKPNMKPPLQPFWGA